MKGNELGRACNTHGEEGRIHWVWWESLKIALGIPISSWNYGIIIDLGEIGWVDMNWIRLAQDRNQTRDILNMVMILQI